MNAIKLLEAINKKGYNVYALDDPTHPGYQFKRGLMGAIENGLAIIGSVYIERQLHGNTEGVVPFGWDEDDIRYFILPACDNPNSSKDVMENAREVGRELGIQRFFIIGPLTLDKKSLSLDRLPDLSRMGLRN